MPHSPLTLRCAVTSPARRRALKIAIAALVGIPWIPIAAALYAWMR